jgi:hypothetical protein
LGHERQGELGSFKGLDRTRLGVGSEEVARPVTDEPPGLPQETFLREYGDAVAEGTAAVFVGAGMSRAAGYVDWAELLSEFALELGLDLDVETDLGKR